MGVTIIHTCRTDVHSPHTDSSDFGLLGEPSSPKMGDNLPITPLTTVRNLTSLALSLPEKSVTVQTNKHTHKLTN